MVNPNESDDETKIIPQKAFKVEPSNKVIQVIVSVLVTALIGGLLYLAFGRKGRGSEPRPVYPILDGQSASFRFY